MTEEVPVQEEINVQ
jgi:hypothetical protein